MFIFKWEKSEHKQINLQMPQVRS